MYSTLPRLNEKRPEFNFGLRPDASYGFLLRSWICQFTNVVEIHWLTWRHCIRAWIIIFPNNFAHFSKKFLLLYEAIFSHDSEGGLGCYDKHSATPCTAAIIRVCPHRWIENQILA